MSFRSGVNQTAKSSEGDGIDSEEAKRSPLFPNFSLSKGNQRNLGITAIIRTIRNRNGHANGIGHFFHH